MLSTTLGQLLINETLPEDMRDYNRTLDKKGIKDLLREVAQRHPEKYRDISFRLSKIGRQVSQNTGGYAFGINHMRKAMAAVKTRQKILSQLQRIVDDDELPDDKRREMIVKITGREMKPQQAAIFEEALKAKNPIAMQVLSGTRGNKMNLTSLLGSDLLYADHHDRPIPIPVLRSYAEGLSPEEYWAGAYGARKGTIATKFATQDAGFFGKQLNQVAHRLVVVDRDYEDEKQRNIFRGVPVDTNDMDNEGALLAHDIGPYKKNTVLTPKILKHLSRIGKKRIVVRSAMVGGSPEGGVYAHDVGIRERGGLPGRGEQVGLTAAQAISEPVSQGQLSAKHSGGVAGEEKAVSGFDYLNQLVQVPKHFKGGAAHAKLDGVVQRIEPAPAGGQYVTIDGEQHYVAKGFDLKIKKGDTVEAGDVLSEGIPNPDEITRYKGHGEGKRYFVQAMRQAMSDAGMTVHRRNLELLARGLINHVRLTEEYGDYVPDDVIPYSTLEHSYQPRDGHARLEPKRALGKYLETPILHYSIGTKIRPSMLKDFAEFGVKELTVHDEPPPFQPEMVRAMTSLQHDPDWMARMYGSGLKKSLLSATHRGGVSDEQGTSFVPSLARSVDFGRLPNAVVRQPGPPMQPSVAPDREEATTLTPAKTPSVAPPAPFKWFGGKFSLSSFGKAAMAKQAAVEPTQAPKPATPAAPKPAAAQAPTAAPATKPGSVPGANPYQAAAASKTTPMPQAAPPAQAAPPPVPRNPYAWGGQSASPNLIQTPFAMPMIQAMSGAMPGIGGVVGLGTMLNSSALATLTSGQHYHTPSIHGTAASPGMPGEGPAGLGGFGGLGGVGGAGGAGDYGTDGSEGSMDFSDMAAALPGMAKGLGEYSLRSWQMGQIAKGMPQASPALRHARRLMNLPWEAMRTATGAPVRAALKGVGAIPGVAETRFGQWTKGLNWLPESGNAIEASQASQAEQAVAAKSPWLRRLLAIKDPGQAAIKGTGGTLKTVGKVAGPLGVAISVGENVYHAGRLANATYQGGLSGLNQESATMADEQADELRTILSGGHGLMTPLSAVGAVYNPVKNVNLIGQGTKQTAETGAEVAQQTGRNYTAGQEVMQKQLGPNPTGYNGSEISNNKQYAQIDYTNPYSIPIQGLGAAGQGVEAGLDWATIKGESSAIQDKSYELDAKQMANLKQQVDAIAQREQAGTPPSAADVDLRNRYAKLQGMTAYQRINEGKGMLSRAGEDALLDRPAIPGVEDFHLPGQIWSVKRMATPWEIWRGDFSLNPFKWRGMEKEQADQFPALGGLAFTVLSRLH